MEHGRLRLCTDTSQKSSRAALYARRSVVVAAIIIAQIVVCNRCPSQHHHCCKLHCQGASRDLLSMEQDGRDCYGPYRREPCQKLPCIHPPASTGDTIESKQIGKLAASLSCSCHLPSLLISCSSQGPEPIHINYSQKCPRRGLLVSSVKLGYIGVDGCAKRTRLPSCCRHRLRMSRQRPIRRRGRASEPVRT